MVGDGAWLMVSRRASGACETRKFAERRPALRVLVGSLQVRRRIEIVVASPDVPIRW